MRTTLNLEDDLVKAAKIEAIRRGVTLTALIEDGLRKVLRTPEKVDEPCRPPVFTNKPNPELDFTRTAELLEQIEGPFAHP